MARKASRRQDEQIIANMMTSTNSKASRTKQNVRTAGTEYDALNWITALSGSDVAAN